MVKERQSMSEAMRAKQFSPFAALVGLDEKVDGAGFIPDDRIVLGPEALAELDRAICGLRKGDIIKVRYYFRGRYVSSMGRVSKFDRQERTIMIGEERVLLDDIIEFEKM